MKVWEIFAVLLLAAICSVRGQQGLSEEEIEEILNAHNYYRSIVDPIASNMLKLVRHSSIYYVRYILKLHMNLPNSLIGLGYQHGLQC